MSNHQDIVFGVNPVLEKLRACADEISEIFISDASSDRVALRQISQEAARLKVPVAARAREFLDQLADGQRHQGVVAKVEAHHYMPFDIFLQRVARPASIEWILALDGITDPRNFGALVRTAEAVGVHYVIVPKDRSAQVTPIAVKASAGAVHHVNIVRVTNLRRAIAELKKHGFWVVGLDAKSAECIYDKTYPASLVVVLGGEGKGIRPIIARECDFLESIPMVGKVGSLNVGVAGAVVLYELFRQSRLARQSV